MLPIEISRRSYLLVWAVHATKALIVRNRHPNPFNSLVDIVLGRSDRGPGACVTVGVAAVVLLRAARMQLRKDEG
jgi:hypothetical protein